MSFSNLMQTTILNILNVAIMMRMTYASFMQFYENVDMSMLWSICHRGGKKGCHGNDNENGATATFWWSDNSLRYRCKRASVRMCGTCKRWWGDPGYRVPTRWWHGNEVKHARDNFGHGANAGISYNTHAFIPRRSFSAVIPSKRAFGAERVRSGSSCSRVVGEVVVLATVVEVVVHVS